jgi:hypothetical protein
VTSAAPGPEEDPSPSASVAANSVTLRLANGPLSAPVLGRVISMVLARADCPMNRLDDAMILCDTLSAHAPAHAYDGHIAYTMDTDAQGIELRVGELCEQGANRLLADAAVPGVGNVLERLSDELRVEPAVAGRAREDLVLRLRFA